MAVTATTAAAGKDVLPQVPLKMTRLAHVAPARYDCMLLIHTGLLLQSCSRSVGLLQC